MKVKPLAAAAALALACSGAFALDTSLGPIDGMSKNLGNSFNAGASGAFTDTYSFSLAGPNVISGIVATFNFGTLFGIDGLNLSLAGGSLGSALTDTSPGDGYTFAGLGAGNYVLSIAGNVFGSGGGAYGGVLQAAPVPEPETYALLLGGLGLVAFVARRRRPPQDV